MDLLHDLPSIVVTYLNLLLPFLLAVATLQWWRRTRNPIFALFFIAILFFFFAAMAEWIHARKESIEILPSLARTSHLLGLLLTAWGAIRAVREAEEVSRSGQHRSDDENGG